MGNAFFAALAPVRRQILTRMAGRVDVGQQNKGWQGLARWSVLLIAILLSLTAWQNAHAQPIYPTPTPAPTPTALPLAEYDARLEEMQAKLESSVNPDRLTPFLAAQLDEIHAISLPSGEVVHPENLLEGVGEGERALGLLHTTRTQMRLAQNDNLAQRQAIVAAAVARTNYLGGFSFWAWIEEMWRRLLNWLFGGEDPFASSTADSMGNALGRVVTVAGGIVVALLLAWWIQRLVRSFVRDADLRRRETNGELPATAAEARTIAAQQARDGSYRAAVRTLYLSALLSLEEADLVAHDRTLTNRELLARAGAAPAGAQIQPAMQPVVQGFDDVWYGEVEPDAQSYATYEGDIARLNERIGAVDGKPKSTSEGQQEARAQ